MGWLALRHENSCMSTQGPNPPLLMGALTVTEEHTVWVYLPCDSCLSVQGNTAALVSHGGGRDLQPCRNSYAVLQGGLWRSTRSNTY